MIHRDAGHPAPQTVTAIGPVLLLHRRGGEIGTSHIELIPAHRCRPVWIIQKNSLAGVKGFGATAVLINQRRHNLVAQCVQSLGCSVLRHKQRGRICECIDEAAYGDVGIRSMVDAEAETRITRGDKIDVKLPAMNLS